MAECNLFCFYYYDNNDGDGIENGGFCREIDNFLLTVIEILGTVDNTITGFNLDPNPTKEALNMSANENISHKKARSNLTKNGPTFI